MSVHKNINSLRITLVLFFDPKHFIVLGEKCAGINLSLDPKHTACPIPINVNNESVSFLSDSFNKQCVSFNARGSDYARTMQDMVQQYERPDDKNCTASGDLMSTKEYYDGTELIKLAFHNKSESVLKLKGTMIPFTVKKGSSRYCRCRYIHEMIGTFRNQHQDTYVTSNSNV